MHLPDDRLPEFDENDEDVVESDTLPEMLDESDELKFESSDADNADDAILEPDEEEEEAGFGFGDPSD